MYFRNWIFSICLCLFILLMFCLTYGFVPVYKLFCQMTGYGGTIKQVFEISGYQSDQKLKILFDAVVHPAFPGVVVPLQSSLDILVGQPVLAFYRVINPTPVDFVGMATYNILPFTAGTYFNKIQCFCFDQQLFKANSTVDLPILFFVDSHILQDKNLAYLEILTLSYTFFRI